MSEWIKNNKYKIIIVSLAVINVLLWNYYFSLPDGNLHIKFYNVGQGDSIYIETPQGYKILIDGGPNDRLLEYLATDVPFYSKNIDLVVLTHPHADHLTGLIEVIKRYQIKDVWVTGVETETREYLEWEKALKDTSTVTRSVSAGDRIVFPDSTILKVLWPKKNYTSEDPNLSSIVIQLSYGEFDSLLTGDAERQVQPYTGVKGSIEVFKVPHQGAGDALDTQYTPLLQPDISVVSVGKNSYGHPHQETLDFLDSINSKVFRTDLNGTIEIVSDGKNWYTDSEK